MSLGSGAALKHDVDISSEFALLPDARISHSHSLNNIDDLGHPSNSATPAPLTDDREVKKASAEAEAAEEFFVDMAHSAAEAADHNEIKESNDDAAKSGEEPPEAFSDLSPYELDAFAEHRRMQAALAEASA